MREKLDKLFDIFLARAKRNMQQDQHLQPVVCLLSGAHTRPDITPIALNFQDEAEKDATATAIEQMIREAGAWGYVMINEAWMLVHDDFKQEGGIPQVQPSQHSKRREAIVIGLFTYDYHRGAAVLFERRGKKIAFTKQIDMAPDMKVAGRFAEMLPPMN